MRRCIMVVVLISLLSAMASVAVAQAQSAVNAKPIDEASSQRDDSDSLFNAWQNNASVRRCGVCHYSPGNDFAPRETDFCSLTELQQWLKLDKHSVARQRIEPIARDAQSKATASAQTARSQPGSAKPSQDSIGESNHLSFVILQRLNYDYAKFREHCLTCHGGYRLSKEPDGFALHDIQQPGISCNYCHQSNDNDNEQWIDEHSGVISKAKWRILAPSVKAEKGMLNLVTADAQAQLCYRCHIGDLQRKMFVTHAMYAAGHPPLPSVELDTLIQAMPRHWRSPAELYVSLEEYPLRAAYFETNYPVLKSLSPDQVRVEQLSWRTDTLVSGAVAAQQQWIRLVAQAAESTSAYWADYALYDCATCHHELRLPSARQASRPAGAPGRPRLLEWPQALARAAAVASGQGDYLLHLNGQLVQAVKQRPFGQREAVRRAALQLDDALEQLKQQSAAERLSDEFARKVLVALAQTPEELLLDYHTARQVNWAIRGIDTEFDKSGHALPRNVRAAIAELGMVPGLTAEFVSTELAGGPRQPIFPTFVKAELARQAAYDSLVFVRQLKAVAESLGIKN